MGTVTWMPSAHTPPSRLSTMGRNSAGLTLSFTRPEPLCRRSRRYSRRQWLLPGDSWEISGRLGLGKASLPLNLAHPPWALVSEAPGS